MSDRTPHAEDPRSARPPTDLPAGAAAPEAGAVSGPDGAAAGAPAPARPDPVEPGPAAGADRAAMNEEDRASWGLTIRVTFYLVGVHIFAAFLFLLLFHLGAK